MSFQTLEKNVRRVVRRLEFIRSNSESEKHRPDAAGRAAGLEAASCPRAASCDADDNINSPVTEQQLAGSASALPSRTAGWSIWAASRFFSLFLRFFLSNLFVKCRQQCTDSASTALIQR